MPRFSIPTTARLPSTLRVDSSNPAAIKSLNRLSRETLLTLALDWLDEKSLPNSFPFFSRPDEDEDDDDDLDDLYPPARSLQELEQLYTELQQQKGSKRDVVSRILEGDWRHGLTLYQLAMADLAYLDEHPTSQKWSAYKIVPLKQLSKDADENENPKVDKQSLSIPRFHPSTFLQALQAQILPDVKAHYHFHRPKDIPVLLLRIFVIDSPYNSDLALSAADVSGAVANFDSSRSILLALPDGSPSLYVSRSQNTGAVVRGESKSLHGLIVDGVPKALSRPQERFTLKSTNLSSRNISALLDKKGPGRANSAGGGWSIYADEKIKISPMDTVLPSPPLSRGSSSSSNLKRALPASRAEQASKRAKLVAKARFGSSGRSSDGKGVERFEVVLQDPFPISATRTAVDENDGHDDGEQDDTRRGAGARRSTIDAALQQVDIHDHDGDEEGPGNSGWTPSLKLTFRGPHVFAGIRQLVEAGIVDGERMPGWMTGEDGVTLGAVRHGRIRGHKGSGL
ncbi:kinetochore protein CHL4 like domain-containing protein [Sarocladium implicatum]|nr:kinetochore protein CHL4 like domain-containing protein [Sarocladium implicatum]